jgi:AraC-like DNA-binding protein
MTERSVSAVTLVDAVTVELFEALVDVIFCAKDTRASLRRGEPRVRAAHRSALTPEVLGARAGDVFPAALAERYEEQDRRVLASGRALRDELELIRRTDGTFGWYVTTKVPVATDGRIAGLVSVSRDLKRPSDETVEVAALSNVVALVRDHDEAVRPLTVADLAAAAGSGVDQLQRRMRRVFGISPTQYLLRERVDRAARLLAASDEPIATVAARCGFYDQAALTRHFGRFIGMTPSQYRMEHRDGT